MDGRPNKRIGCRYWLPRQSHMVMLQGRDSNLLAAPATHGTAGCGHQQHRIKQHRTLAILPSTDWPMTAGAPAGAFQAHFGRDSHAPTVTRYPIALRRDAISTTSTVLSAAALERTCISLRTSRTSCKPATTGQQMSAAAKILSVSWKHQNLLRHPLRRQTVNKAST
jgi:hypothetical protein